MSYQLSITALKPQGMQTLCNTFDKMAQHTRDSLGGYDHCSRQSTSRLDSGMEEGENLCKRQSPYFIPAQGT